MSADLSLACECGKVRAVIRDVSPRVGDYIVCHCNDCQQFATRFDAGERILDTHGGTHLYQGRCARLEVREGKEYLAAIHLTDKPTLRWYASCCDTPMFNTYANGKLPYVTSLLANADRGAVEAALDKPIGHLHTADAPVHPEGVPEMSMGQLLRRFFKRMVKDVFSGDRRRSALFDPETLQPIATPHRVGDARA